MKKLGCECVFFVCFILLLTDFSTFCKLKIDKKTRMHNVHPSFFILQLPDFSTFSKLKDEKARMHNVHPSFFILQLIEFSASWLFRTSGH